MKVKHFIFFLLFTLCYSFTPYIYICNVSVCLDLFFHHKINFLISTNFFVLRLLFNSPLLYNFDFWILKKTLIGTLLEHQFLSTFSPKMEFGSTPANELYFAVSIAIEQCSNFRQIKDSPNLEKNIFAVSLVYAVHYILIENLLSS